MVMAETSTFAISVAEMSVAKMSGPKRLWPKWITCQREVAVIRFETDTQLRVHTRKDFSRTSKDYPTVLKD